MIDMDSLMKGQDYTELKDCYILFICKKDPFMDADEKPYGLPCYTFRNMCIENSGVKLNDKSVKVIYNASAYREENDLRIRDFLHFVCTNEPGKDEFSNRLSAIVEKLKVNEKFKGDYLVMNLHDRDLIRRTRKEAIEEGIAMGISQGISQGARNNAVENAQKALKMNLSVEQVSEITSLSLEEVRELTKVIADT